MIKLLMDQKIILLLMLDLDDEIPVKMVRGEPDLNNPW